MSAFNMDKLRGSGRGFQPGNRDESTRQVRPGDGLLNAASKELKTTKLGKDILYLQREQIVRNEANFYSLGDIESLADSIGISGLDQPLIVTDSGNGTYRLLGGERRLKAIDLLIETGRLPEDVYIPCVPKGLSEVKLPVEDELKELYAIITTNREQRDYTDADTLAEIRNLRKLYDRLRELGVDNIDLGFDENGEPRQKKIKGEKTRDLIAQDMHLSAGTIARFDKVDNQGSDKLIQAVEENKISIGAAANLVDLPPEKQDEFVDKMAAVDADDIPAVTPKAVETYKKTGETPEAPEPEKDLSFSEIAADMKSIMYLVPEDSTVTLSEKDFKAYKSSVGKLRKLLTQKHK